ncbi:nucleoporin subcomplex protein binding to Pom34-domain-containing protein [Boeremia exigua]|uniref:nucleoporin subcomplex protein binding to Pom34-domain-containing protein n=1 Tax=Boeremia exigua TaxID=749465 RepID=UPI001E8D6DA7|nr:nucleoporin subcomplex protein binding to Pom34-domain-containing protein [Boeremia exigua]KAH6625132.1 nucleoporin subcomplex protein binding to Pom34-domain-containing protein [Boeremia exigua]
MAPIPSTEFDLAKCLKGEQQLVTWDIAYRALCEPRTASRSEALRDFLTVRENVEILSRPWKPFADPSPQEKSRFEAKTAPISVAPAQQAHFSLDEIKADSLWLSRQAQISEYAALQVVAQEWQSRPTVQLLSGLTEEEALSVQDAAGLANLGASTFVPNSSIMTPLASRSTQFDTQDQRRLRIIEIYHSTCASIIRISQLLISWGAAPQLRSQTIYGNDYHTVGAGWIEELGKNITTAQISGPATALDQCLQAVKKRCETLDEGYAWDVAETIIEAASEKWVTAQTVELLHLLHLAHVHADVVTKGFVPAATIEEWLTTFSTRGFFREFPVVTPRQEPLVPVIQLLTSLVSLAILKIDAIVNDLDSDDCKNWETSAYILNTGVLETITNVFGEARMLGPSPATPPMFAWAIMTWKLTSKATLEEQERESLLESPDASRRPLPEPSAIEEAAMVVGRLEGSELFEGKTPYQELAEASSAAGVLVIVDQLVETGLTAFGTPVDQISRDRLRLSFLQLLRAALGSEVVVYSPDLIVTAYSILGGDRSFRAWAGKGSFHQADPVVSFFLEDEDVLRPLLLNEARLRYPYESTPFLKFFSVLTRGDKTVQNGLPTFVEKLTETNQLMQRLPQGFAGYALTREEENANWVELTEDLPLFSSGSNSSVRGGRRLLTSSNTQRSGGLMTIPAGTEGVIVDDSEQPYVAVWRYRHSTLTYLVQLLSSYPSGSGRVEYTSQEPATKENAVEIVGLFADLLHSALQSSEGTCSVELLEALSINSDGGQDTVSIVLAVFEEELLRLCQEPGNEASLELLVNCTHFLEALVLVAPNRVWPFLARSRLLEGDGNGGSLAAILIGTEMVLGRYDFLIGCIRLYDSLVTDAVDRSVARKNPSRALSRFNASNVAESGTSDKIMSTTLFTFGRTLASIYESSLSWKYTRPDHRPEINIAICDVFTKIMKLAYGVDDAPQLSAKLTKLVAPIAEYITQQYLAKSESNLPTNPILASLVIGAGSDGSTLLTSSAALWKQQTETTLQLASTLVRVALLLDRPWTHLEQQLFKATPLLARLYATSDRWKSPVLRLLETLVRGAVRVTESQSSDGSAEQQEPPSLLGHLGPRTAKNFLSVLSELDEPLRIVDIQTDVWNLLSAVVTCKQQWFSLYLLTGNTPKESLRTKPDSAAAAGHKALLTWAIQSVSNMNLSPSAPTDLSWPLYTAKLEFITSAQNNWSWAMGDLRKHKDLIQKLLEFLFWMTRQLRNPKTNTEILQRSHQNRFASLACEVLAMYLHSSRQAGDITPLKDVVPALAYLQDNALELPAYNESLHSNLKQNLERQFPGVTLANLKRTALYPESFGRSFFYDLELAEQLLDFDNRWAGPREGTGFVSEVEKANYNLGLVESQVQLLQSWKLLALELGQFVGKDERLVQTVIDVVRRSMKANAESNLPEALFGQLNVLRADLSFGLLKRLAEAKIHTKEARQLLVPVWNAIRASTPDFDSVFSGDAVFHYRSQLRILYLVLQPHLIDDAEQNEEAEFRSSFRGTMPASHNTMETSSSTLLLEILSDAIAKGIRSLANQLHADPATVSPSDFALLTAILQRIIAIPEMSKWQTQASLVFENSGTIRYATSLFSWSDRLTITQNGVADPVYGELALLFLLSLSAIPSLAETMAVEGVLSQLNTANIMTYYRRPAGMGPFDTPARLHSIWAKALLPLCLNLLLSIGPPIAAEISSFLNQFPEQLARASAAINASPSSRFTATKITLAVASETHSLALIAAILENTRKQAPKLGVQDVALLDWDRENVKEDVESWLSRKSALRERVVAVDEREVEMLGRKRGDLNELEERVLGELEDVGRCLGLGK